MLNLEDCTNVIDYLNDINENFQKNGIKHINIHKLVEFKDYPFLIRIKSLNEWIIKNSDVKDFNILIQDKVLNNKNYDDETKDEICIILQQLIDKYQPYII